MAASARTTSPVRPSSAVAAWRPLGEAAARMLDTRIVEKLACTRYAPPITKAELFLTEACTLRCDYCFVASKQASNRMSWPTAKKAVDFLIEHSREAEAIEITFFGGEPFLEFDLMQRIAEYAEQQAVSVGKHVHYAVTTNGTLLTEPMIRFTVEHGFMCLLSIDGNKATHDQHRRTPRGRGSWSKVAAKLPLLRRAQGWIGARMTVNPDTAHSLSSDVRALFALGVNQFLLGMNADVEWSAEELGAYVSEMGLVLDFYLEEMAKGSHIRIADFEGTIAERRGRFSCMWGCDAGKSRISISTSGAIYPCARFVSSYPGVRDQYRLGDLDRGVTNVEARFDLLDNGDRRRPKCAACGYRDRCSGGCPAVNLHRMGSIFDPCPVDCTVTPMWVDLVSRAERERKPATEDPCFSGTSDTVV